MGFLPLLREAAAAARSGPVASALTTLMVAGMVIAVMLTTGRTVAAEQQVLGTIDAAGTRSITIRADAAAGVTADVVDRLGGIEGIEWVGAFTSAVDGTNALIPDGTRVPVRTLFTPHPERIGLPSAPPLPDEIAYASAAALQQLGLPDGSGGIALTTGGSRAVAPGLDVPDFLAPFEPLVVVPSVGDPTALISAIVIVAERPDLVAAVSDAALSVLAPLDPSKVAVQTSESLAQLRAVLEGQLSSFSRGLMLALLAITGVLVAVVLYGLVLLRRKDFGRRRALGATRGLIVGLLLTQTALTAVLGAVAGLTASVATLALLGDPLPDLRFGASLAILAVLVATVAAVAPAIVASRRDPIRELRVP